jgi:hypothetical protein
MLAHNEIEINAPCASVWNHALGLDRPSPEESGPKMISVYDLTQIDSLF